jgi:hypothetical protein
MYSAARLRTIESLIPLLQHTEHWNARWGVELYVTRCIEAGFCKTSDQIKLCAERFLAGKRRVTPPGTKRRKVAERKQREILKNTPPELMAAVTAAIADNAKAIDQYKSGTEKALNAVVGAVMKRHKADPAIVRLLLIEAIK